MCSVQFSRLVVSDSLRPHESQYTRPPCPSQTHGVYSNSCSSSWWCHPAISSSVIPFSACPQSLPASGSFPTSQLFAWGGQRIGVSVVCSSIPSANSDGFIFFPSKLMSFVFLWNHSGLIFSVVKINVELASSELILSSLWRIEGELFGLSWKYPYVCVFFFFQVYLF